MSLLKLSHLLSSIAVCLLIVFISFSFKPVSEDQPVFHIIPAPRFSYQVHELEQWG